MNASSWLKQAKKQIDALDAELIAVHFLHLADRSELPLAGERELTAAGQKRLAEMLERRQKGEPLAYIIGKKEFYGREFYVDERVLIPRPETEVLVEKVLALEPRSVVDVGTGSGCIAITLALELPDASVTGLDIFEDALAVARENAERLGAKVQWQHSDLLADYRDTADVVVANLPYVDPAWEWCSPELKKEPEQALFAEDGGLAVIWRLLESPQLRQARYLALEADPLQHESIIKRAKQQDFNLTEQEGFTLIFTNEALA